MAIMISPITPWIGVVGAIGATLVVAALAVSAILMLRQ